MWAHWTLDFRLLHFIFTALCSIFLSQHSMLFVFFQTRTVFSVSFHTDSACEHHTLILSWSLLLFINCLFLFLFMFIVRRFQVLRNFSLIRFDPFLIHNIRIFRKARKAFLAFLRWPKFFAVWQKGPPRKFWYLGWQSLD